MEYTPKDMKRNARILLLHEKFLYNMALLEYNAAATTGDVKPRLKDIISAAPKIGEILEVDIYTSSEVSKGEVHGEAINADAAPNTTESNGSGNSLNREMKDMFLNCPANPSRFRPDIKTRIATSVDETLSTPTTSP